MKIQIPVQLKFIENKNLTGQAKIFLLSHIPILLPFRSPRRLLLGIPNGIVDIKRGEGYMRSQYSYLNVTPYLYSSKELRQMYNESRSRKETESILTHMRNHAVFDNKEYKGYFNLSQVIEEDLYGEEEDILNWQDLMERYQIVATKSGIKFREKEELVEGEWL